MKFLAVLALTPAVFGAVMPRDAALEKLPDGRYVSTIKSDGSVETTFVPLSEIHNSEFVPKIVDIANETLAASVSHREAGALDKRGGGGCEGFFLNDGEVDRANDCLMSMWNFDPVRAGAGQKFWCVAGGAKSYLCAYEEGSKEKREMWNSLGYIRHTQCGPQRAGFDHVNGGSGNWAIGYTFHNAGFCAF